MSKPSTPVRRSKVGPGRPGSAGTGGEIPMTASMEVLTPDPSVPAMKASMDVGRSQDLVGYVNGSKPRTPGSARLSRARSTDGRRSALLASGGPLHLPHEVIPLTSTTAKSLSSNHIIPPHIPLPSASPYASTVGLPASVGPYVQAWPVPTQSDVGLSTASSMRFNPVTEGEDDAGSGFAAAPGSHPQPAPPGDDPHVSRVQVGGSAAAVAQRAASAAGSSRGRYSAAAESVALSLQQQEGSSGLGLGGAAAASEAVRGSAVEDSEPPGTPGSVASGRMGGTFFTDLHRSFGDGSRLRMRGVDQSQDLTGALDGGEGEGDELDVRASRQPRASTMTSRLNPMQSPSSSEDGTGDEDDSFAEYAGEDAGQGAPPPPDPDPDTAGEPSMSALTDYSNPLQTPQDSRLATPLLPSAAGAASTEVRASLLTVIRDLYVTDPEPPPPPPVAAWASRPATAAEEEPPPPSPAPAPEPESDSEEDDEARDEVGALAASRAAVAALAARVDSQQSKRRSELGEYMTALQGLKDDSGSKLVELPVDWGVMIERLFRQRRSEFATLEGWMGPRRFEDLPINQLHSDNPDPRVEEGLARIRELDSVLNDKLIAALISHRETFPDQWAEQERQRLEKHSKGVEEALKRERQKRLRAARISRAVTSLDGPPGSVADMDGGLSRGSLGPLAEQPSSIYSRLFTLKPEEEALVEQVMQRNDDEGAAINPFDLESAAVYGSGSGAAAQRPAAGGRHGGPLALLDVDADPDDLDVDLDRLLPSSAAASACPTPTGPMPRTVLRPLSARAVDRSDASAADTSRPHSAASFGQSRPGTSSGPQPGLSPIAAAALHGHPALLAHSTLRASTTGEAAGGLLPSRVYEDPRAAARALRAINARLAAFEAEHLWDESGALADFKSISQQQQQQQQQPQSEQPAGSAAPAPAASVRAASPPRSVRSGAGGAAASVTGVSVTEAGQRDYLREERVAKELASRERDLDVALRQLKTGEVVRLGEATLKALVEQCRRLQELNEHRRKIEEAEAAARKAQQQRQQLLAAAAANGRGPGSPRTPKGGQASPSPAAAAAAAASTPGSAGGGGAPGRGAPKGLPPPPRQQQQQQHQGPGAATEGASPSSSGATWAGPRGGGGTAAAAASGGSSSGRSGQGAAVGGQRHNSAGSRSHATGAGGGSGSGAATASPQGVSRRASDPATSASPSGSAAAGGFGAAAAAGSSGSSGAGGGSGPSGGASGVRSSKSSVSTGAAAVGGAGAAPKPRPSGLRASSASASSSAAPSTTASIEIAGLPPPPPPPPP